MRNHEEKTAAVRPSTASLCRVSFVSVSVKAALTPSHQYMDAVVSGHIRDSLK
jgi:hypothetical protein